MSLTKRLLLVVGASGALLAWFLLVVRPWYLDWGASEQEKRGRLPGDQIIPGAQSQTTRALTVNAPAERVWPWIAQIGQDRAGFYSYEILEDLAGCEMPRRYHLDPSLQRWNVGDKLWMYPPRKYHGAGHAVLMVLEPGRALGFATRQVTTPLTEEPDGSWAFIVQPLTETTSRLIFRGRGTVTSPMLEDFNATVFEPMHYAMERRMLENVKVLAEGGSTSKALENLQVALWALTFLSFVASAILIIAGRRVWLRLGTLLGAGMVFAFLTIVQPDPQWGVPAVLALVIVLWMPRWNDPHPAPRRRQLVRE